MSSLVSGLRVFAGKSDAGKSDAGKSDDPWREKKPQKGDHIRVMRKFMGYPYKHHGIYVSDREVIHFTGKKDGKISGKDNMIITTSLAEFLDGRTLQVREYSNKERQLLNDPETIVRIARAHLGEKHYSLVFNNCEHFANLCTLNVKRSEQVLRYARLVCGSKLAEAFFY